jgi:hypothetical protein
VTKNFQIKDITKYFKKTYITQHRFQEVLLHLPRFCLTNQPYHLLHQENNLPYGFVKMGLFLLQLDITTIEKKNVSYQADEM